MAAPTTTFAIAGDEDRAAVVATLTGLRFELGPTELVTSTLLDTFDGRVHAAGLRLTAHRTDGVELVLSGDGSVAARLAVVRTPRAPADIPPGKLRSRVGAIVGVRALLAQVSVTCSRTPATLFDARGDTVVAATIDDGLRLAGGDMHDGDVGLDGVRSTVAVHRVSGHSKRARAAVEALERLQLVRLAGDTLTIAADAAHVDLAGFDGSPGVPLDATMPAIDGFRAVLAHLAETIVANWQGTIDRVDPEFLHDLRVAVRRTRSVLTHGNRVMPSAIRDRARERFAELSELTGPPRDLDVYLLGWSRYTSPLGHEAVAALVPVFSLLVRRREEAYATLIDRMRSREAAELLTMWQTWLRGQADDQTVEDRAHDPLGAVVARRISKAQAELIEHGRQITPDSPAEQLHSLRKDAKKLRYLLECFGSLLARAPRKQLVKRLKVLQENLGMHQDSAVQLTELQMIARELRELGSSPETMLAIGRLIGGHDRDRGQARGEFAERFAAYDSPVTRRAVRAALGGLSR